MIKVLNTNSREVKLKGRQLLRKLNSAGQLIAYSNRKRYFRYLPNKADINYGNDLSELAEINTSLY